MKREQTTHAVLGADGQIGSLLVRELLGQDKKVVAISPNWNHHPFGDAVEYRSADATDQASLLKAFAGCDVLYVVVGLPYSTKLWQQLWPVIVQNILLALKANNCRLIFLDNVYAYGHVTGVMTEETPYNPCSQKGYVRLQLVQLIKEAMQAD